MLVIAQLHRIFFVTMQLLNLSSHSETALSPLFVALQGKLDLLMRSNCKFELSIYHVLQI